MLPGVPVVDIGHGDSQQATNLIQYKDYNERSKELMRITSFRGAAILSGGAILALLTACGGGGGGGSTPESATTLLQSDGYTYSSAMSAAGTNAMTSTDRQFISDVVAGTNSAGNVEIVMTLSPQGLTSENVAQAQISSTLSGTGITSRLVNGNLVLDGTISEFSNLP